MISEQDCMKILNAGNVKFSAEEVRQIRDLLVDLAAIEYEDYINRKPKGKGLEYFKLQEPRKAA